MRPSSPLVRLALPLALPLVLLAGCSQDPAGPAPDAPLAADVVTAPKLPTPTGLVAVARGTGEIDLTWTDNASAETGYVVYRATSSGGSYLTLKTLAADSRSYANIGLPAGTRYCYKVQAKGGNGWSTSASSNYACARTDSVRGVRIVTFGDSNTDYGWSGASGPALAASYVSAAPLRLPPDSNSRYQLAGKLALGWRAQRSDPILVVNHAIAGTTTGGGGYGGPNRRSTGAPEARTVSGSSTRYEAEVLGKAYRWSGGEPVNSSYPQGAVKRDRAYVPGGATDYAYVSMGTNDPTANMTVDQTNANLTWMVDRWLAAGGRADHFFLTTLAPRTDDVRGDSIPKINARIRALAQARGVVLIDLAAYTSADDGLTWRSSSLHVGDGVHYAESVRDWIAGKVLASMRATAPAP
jgi:hypothetical protein